MTDFIKASFFILVSQIWILMGIFFISGQLMPTLLAPLYAALSNAFLRTLAAAIIVFPIANFGLAYTYGHFNPAMVAPLTIALIVLTNIGFTMAILGVRPSAWIGLAVLCVIASCVWASVLLQQKPQ